MRLLITSLLLFSFSFVSQSQTDSSHTIKVHFLYGSKPLKKFKATEMKYFGGMHGGHVTIEVDSIDYGFAPTGKVHMLPHKRKCHSQFSGKHTHNQPPYPKGYKVVSFTIPISEEQYIQINKIHNHYLAKPPYDYAFFGMRCSAATEDILGQIGVLKKKKRKSKIVRTNFYPKKLRKRMFKLAEKNKYTVVKQDGRPTRKWEND